MQNTEYMCNDCVGSVKRLKRKPSNIPPTRGLEAFKPPWITLTGAKSYDTEMILRCRARCAN